MGIILPDCFWIILFYYAIIQVFTDFKRPVTLFLSVSPDLKVFFYILRPNFLNISLSSEIVVPEEVSMFPVIVALAPLQNTDSPFPDICLRPAASLTSAAGFM